MLSFSQNHAPQLSGFERCQHMNSPAPYRPGQQLRHTKGEDRKRGKLGSRVAFQIPHPEKKRPKQQIKKVIFAETNLRASVYLEITLELQGGREMHSNESLNTIYLLGSVSKPR